MNETERLVARFLKYVKIPSASKEGVMDRFPSTPEQLEIGKMLVTELKELGLGDARMSEHGYVFATLPGNLPAGKAPVIGLLAHMDTYPGVSGRNVQPMIHRNYDGKDIVLSDSQVLKISENQSWQLQELVAKQQPLFGLIIF